ncbi:MAG: hypothetical protein K6E70_02730 [Butyrivibrio sp.]|nr:hypothetical protein [Butyrivibrio sp.]
MGEREKGSVIVEASLSLSFFMFFIITLLTFINICTAQAKIGIALNESAKEISQYGYLYSLTGLNETQQRKYKEGDTNRADIDACLNATEQVKDTFDTIAAVDFSSPEDVWNAGETTVETAKDVKKTAKTVYNNIKKNKADYGWALIKVVGNEIEEGIKGAVGGAFAKGLMYKHLTNSSGKDPDKYLKHLGVIDGMDGLSLLSSSIFTNGSDNITLVCNYDIRVIRLLNIDVKYNVNQVAKTMAWSGNSLVRETPSDKKSDGDGGSGEAGTGEADDEESEESKAADDAVRQKMIDKYDEDIVDAIEDVYDTSGWTEDDWEYHIKLYKGLGDSDSGLLDENGKFKDPKLEADYQKYVTRKNKEGKTPKDRLAWKEASDYWKNDSPMARGNRFNDKVNKKDKKYPFYEVHLENGKRLDGYDPVAGEIVSRKATDLDKISEQTFRQYLSEFDKKYKRGTVIRSNAWPEIDGQKLEGKYILEIPASNENLSNIDYYKKIAAEYGVTLRFTEE